MAFVLNKPVKLLTLDGATPTNTAAILNFVQGSNVTITLTPGTIGGIGSIDVEIAASLTGGGVTSVNGLTGVVVLDPDDLDDSATTNKFTTAGDITKLAGIAAGAEVNVNADWNSVAGDSQILNKPSTFAPSAHASSHQAAGGDSIQLDNLAATDDNTDLDASTTKHGLMMKYPGGTTTFLRADGSFAAPSVTATFPKGHIYGLVMTYATAATVTIAAGECISDDGAENMVLSSAITKSLASGWAVGTGNGGLNTGAEANSTWYEVHLIKRTDTGVVDVMFTTTGNRATLPTNYTKKRRIGWIRNDGSGNILQFVQTGSYVTLVTPQNDVSTIATAARTTRTLTAPPSTIARFRAACLGNTAVNAANGIVFSELVEADTAPTTTNGFLSIGAGDFAIMGTCHIELRVNTSSQISDRAITATGSMAYNASTYGWIDARGRDDSM